jgi:hypothetical protein
VAAVRCSGVGSGGGGSGSSSSAAAAAIVAPGDRRLDSFIHRSQFPKMGGFTIVSSISSQAMAIVCSQAQSFAHISSYSEPTGPRRKKRPHTEHGRCQEPFYGSLCVHSAHSSAHRFLCFISYHNSDAMYSRRLQPEMPMR